MPDRVAPMLASSAAEPFDSPDHIFELMWGGVRTEARIRHGNVALLGRNGLDLTPSFPELRSIPDQFSAHEALLDGEIVALDGDGNPSFDLLRDRLAPLVHLAAVDGDNGGAAPATKAKRGGGQIMYQ